MTAAPARTARPDTASADSPIARLLTRLTSRLTDRLLGTALAVAACDPPAALHASPLVKMLVVGAAVAAWWAAPMVDARPVQTSTRLRALAARRRTTVLPAAAIAAAAFTGPPFWLVVCVAALLLAYLLVTDPWTAGVTAPAGHPRAAPALTAAAATAVVLLVAQAPVAGASWARLPASLAVAATVVCLVLALRARRRPPG
ncbi:hypothetical protein HTV80_27740 [Streptomyces sp. Vc74B-19]|uniref:hypothetical protein n=1 Tax=unclassified Streptomyces TaxID=2593676 RepID=UPI001BFBFED4|nr:MULTISPECIES: hypothetical protein [unclassified Streptomyces]MBT3166861.1 hypothetical protein [Streptomyces sp. Vc74B-19]MCO4697203.1 hypothetical protein [Streptomyces sp. RO-S4]MDU0304271.1 hypothetical protein [Streptomyces sp. PAL114]